MARVRLVGAGGGAIFAILGLVAFVVNPGPSSLNGETVVAYYSAHGTATTWQAALVGLAAIFFIWFAETLAWRMSSGSLGLVGAASTVGLFLVAIGAWEELGETYGGASVLDIPTEAYGEAHAQYAIGVGATHFANFTIVAFVGSTATAMLAARAAWRRLGWVSIGFGVIQLVDAIIVLASKSHWSDVVGSVVFLAFLAWAFVISVMLVLTARRDPMPVHHEAASSPPPTT